ncbi:MAG: hypothetical protein R3E11_02255 [Sphingobium sp.]|nr:hypothetical protein [Sphingobium sp.]MCP5398313.1 hypothetical protein [Sphingomonas sp.]
MTALPMTMRKGTQIAQARAAQKRGEIADEANAIPGVHAHVEDEAVVLEGRGLLDRWIREASLRHIGRI